MILYINHYSPTKMLAGLYSTERKIHANQSGRAESYTKSEKWAKTIKRSKVQETRDQTNYGQKVEACACND